MNISQWYPEHSRLGKATPPAGYSPGSGSVNPQSMYVLRSESFGFASRADEQLHLKLRNHYTVRRPCLGAPARASPAGGKEALPPRCLPPPAPCTRREAKPRAHHLPCLTSSRQVKLLLMSYYLERGTEQSGRPPLADRVPTAGSALGERVLGGGGWGVQPHHWQLLSGTWNFPASNLAPSPGCPSVPCVTPALCRLCIRPGCLGTAQGRPCLPEVTCEDAFGRDGPALCRVY